MKKLLTLVLALAMTLSLAACGGGGEDTADEGSEGSSFRRAHQDDPDPAGRRLRRVPGGQPGPL